MPWPARHAGQRLRELGQAPRRPEQRGGVDGSRRHQIGRGAEAVQHGHRAEHGDLVVVDPERGQRHGGVAAGHPEDQQPPAAVQHGEPGLDRGRRPGGVHHHAERAPVQFGHAGRDIVRADCLGRGQPGRVPVHHTDRGRARVAQQLQQQQAHRARPGEQDVGAGDRPDAAQPVHRAGQRLDERALRVVHAVRDAVGVGRGHRHVLGECAVHGVADGVPVRAQVAPPAAARRAVPAEQRRVHGHPLAIPPAWRHPGAAGHHPAGELVPGNDRVRRGRELAVGDVHVGPADAAHAHLDDQLTVPRCGVGCLGDAELPGLLPDDRAHGCPLSRRAAGRWPRRTRAGERCPPRP